MLIGKLIGKLTDRFGISPKERCRMLVAGCIELEVHDGVRSGGDCVEILIESVDDEHTPLVYRLGTLVSYGNNIFKWLDLSRDTPQHL